METSLEVKIARAIRLIQSAGSSSHPVEVCYSGGKDSDILLALTRMAGVNYRAIYKCTTIDPPGTVAHVRAQGAEIMKRDATFFQMIAKKGAPSRFRRWCCSYFKEYKVLDRQLVGVRRCESAARAGRYNEPTKCRFYGSKKEHAEQFYPLLDWTDDDVAEFIRAFGVKLHPLYYRPDGSVDVTKRLGCIGCPLASTAIRRAQFLKYPIFLRAWINSQARFIALHPDSHTARRFADAYEWAVQQLFFKTYNDWKFYKEGLFDAPNCREIIEHHFFTCL